MTYARESDHMLKKALAVTILLSATVSLTACGGDDETSTVTSCDRVELPEDLGVSGNLGWISERADARDAGRCLTADDARAYVDKYKSTESAESFTEATQPTTSRTSPNTSFSAGSSATTNSRSGTAAQSASVDDRQVQ